MDNYTASKITTADYAAIVAGATHLAKRASAPGTDPANAAHLARAARDLITVAQAFKADSVGGGYRVNR